MRRLASLLLLLLVFAIPWEYSLDLGPPVGNIARVVGVLLLVAAVPAALLGGRIRNAGALQWLTLALFLWLCCSYIWTMVPQATLEKLRGYPQEIMIVWLVWEFAEGPEDLRNLLRSYVAGSWVLALLTLASLASPEADGQVRFVAAGQDPNDVARFLDFGFPMAGLLMESESRREGKLLSLGYLPLGMIGVLLTASRSGFLAALVALIGCGVLLVRSHARRMLAVLYVLPALVAGFWFVVPREAMERIATIPEELQGGDLNQRLNIWHAGWQAFTHAPFFGSGAGSFVAAARLAPIDTAHNTALGILVEGGIVAMVLVVAVVAVCAHSAMQTRGSVRIALITGLLVWIVSSLVATLAESRATWLLLALIALAGRLARDDPDALDACFRPAPQRTTRPEKLTA